MRLGLRSFTGTTTEPGPEPGTGSFAARLDNDTKRRLVEEIRANAHKLVEASIGERAGIVLLVEKIVSPPPKLHILEWCLRNRRQTLFMEFVEASFQELLCLIRANMAQTGKERDREEVTATIRNIMTRIKKDHDEELEATRQRKGSDSRYIGCSCVAEGGRLK